ncbi:MAG TPA: glycosyl hydrolase, partial [Anaerolineae bacterium]
EQYARETPPEVWSHIRAIFTDEPSLMTPYVSELPLSHRGKIPVIDTPLFVDRPPAVPWVEDFAAHFMALKGYDLTPYLFALFTSESEESCYVRQDYYDVVTRLYTDAFYTQVLAWCRAHGVASSGHILAEENIVSHVAFHGSLFAPIRQMDLPGIDMLNSDPLDMLAGDSFMTIKQVSSAAHLVGRKRIHSESSDFVQGLAGKHATLPERCGQGNLQYVLGVNQITAYWGWKEIGEEAYHQYNDYMGRLASLLVGGNHVCDVALLYPVRSVWAHFLPSDKPLNTGAHPGQEPEWVVRVANSYPELVRDLLRQQIDLDIIDEEAIITGQMRDGALYVADEQYRAIVLPPVHALSLDTAKALAAFVQAGGLLISAGPLPELAESAAGSLALRKLFKGLFDTGGSARIVAAGEIAPYLRAHLAPDFTLAEANPDILYTHRQMDGKELYFIINNTPAPVTLQPTLCAPGPYKLYRPMNGSVTPATIPLCIELAGYEGVFVVA